MTLLEIKNIERSGQGGEWRDTLRYLSFECGEHIGIIGSSDSGKTGIAFILVGKGELNFVRGVALLEGRSIEEIPERELRKKTAIVTSDPSLLFSGIRTTLRGELDLSLEMLGINPDSCLDSLQETIVTCAIAELLEREPFSFSGGEQVRAALALAIVKQPHVLVLDDIFGALDADSAMQVRRVIRTCLRKGCAVVETHSVAPEWIGDFEKCVFLARPKPIVGKYQEIWRSIAQAEPELLPAAGSIAWMLEQHQHCVMRTAPARMSDLEPYLKRTIGPHPSGKRAEEKEPTCAFQISEIGFAYPAGGFRLGPISLSLAAGRAAVLLGPNGAGKTTLLKVLALLLNPQTGNISVASPSGWHSPDWKRKHRWARQVLYCFQNPDDQISLPTVRSELVEIARLSDKPDAFLRCEEVASQLDLTRFLDLAPIDLPRSLRRLVTIGAALVAGPPVLLLDEPTAGLDGHQKVCVGRALASYLHKGGTALMVTHDYNFAFERASLFFIMRDGKLTTVAEYDGEGVWPEGAEPAFLQLSRALALQPPIRSVRDLYPAVLNKSAGL